jgi:hypothetical protein
MTDIEKEDQRVFEVMDEIAKGHPRHAKIGIGPRRPDVMLMSREMWDDICCFHGPGSEEEP